jgi:hypothetical protein
VRPEGLASRPHAPGSGDTGGTEHNGGAPVVPVSSVDVSLLLGVIVLVGSVAEMLAVVESSTVAVIDVVDSVSLVVACGPPQIPSMQRMPSPHCASALHGKPVALPPSKHATGPKAIQTKHALRTAAA